jgi:hypothetical protein
MALRKRGGIWYFRKMINGQLFRESTGFADRKAAERRANEIELDIRAGVHGWKSTIPSFAEWWNVYRKTYTPLKSAGNRDAQIVAHFLPHFGARRLWWPRASRSRFRSRLERAATSSGCRDGVVTTEDGSGLQFVLFVVVVATLRLC